MFTHLSYIFDFFSSFLQQGCKKKALNVSTLSFLESPDTEAAMDFGASEVMESEVLYDCVICGQSGPSTEDRPFGLVVLLQASSGMPSISHCVLKFRNAELKQMFCVLILINSSSL